MQNFTYKARDSSSKLIRNVIEAENERRAVAAIESMGLSLVSISSRPAILGQKILTGVFNRISHQDLLLFTRQLSALLVTGVPLMQALENTAEQTDKTGFKQIVNDIILSVKSGRSFSDSLSMHPGVFNNLYISMVKVGEAAGILDKVLSRLADLSTKEIDMRSRLRSALMYPAILAIVAFVIVNFVLVGVLPKFVAIFEASSAKLPIPTRILLFSSDILRKYWWFLILAAIAAFSRLRVYYLSKNGRYKIDLMLLRMPIFGPLTLKIIVSRFSRSVAALTKSGIPILEALSVIEPTISNVVIQDIISKIRVSISQGQSLTEPFKASGLFPPMVIQFISTGERSGKLNEMFDQIADFYEPEIDFMVRNMTSLLEPVMLLGMGGIVVFIALSVLLPIFNLISIIRR